jgi:hypothetical protein
MDRPCGQEFVPLVASCVDEEVLVSYDGTEIRVPVDPLGALNETVDSPFNDPTTRLEKSLRCFDMELAGYGWLSGVAGCVYLDESDDDKRCVAKLVEKRLTKIVDDSLAKDDHENITRHLVETSDLPAALKDRLKETHKSLHGEDL